MDPGESGQGPRGACRQGRPRQAEKGGVRSIPSLRLARSTGAKPEPLHLDLVIEDDRVIEAIPQIGFVHRGLEKLTEKARYASVWLHRRAHLRHLRRGP